MADEEVRRGQVVVEDVQGGLEGRVQGQVGDLGGEGGGGGFGGGEEGRGQGEDVGVEGGEGGMRVGSGHGVGTRARFTEREDFGDGWVGGGKEEERKIEGRGERGFGGDVFRRRHYFSHCKTRHMVSRVSLLHEWVCAICARYRGLR